MRREPLAILALLATTACSSAELAAERKRAAEEARALRESVAAAERRSTEVDERRARDAAASERRTAELGRALVDAWAAAELAKKEAWQLRAELELYRWHARECPRCEKAVVARVSDVKEQRVVLAVGASGGVKEGATFWVRRGTSLVARLLVERVEKATAGCVVAQTGAGEEIRVGDLAVTWQD